MIIVALTATTSYLVERSLSKKKEEESVLSEKGYTMMPYHASDTCHIPK